MSLIMDALEKAQRDKDRKKGELTEENLLHPVLSRKAGSGKKLFTVLLLTNLVVIMLISGGVVLFRSFSFSKKDVSSPPIIKDASFANRQNIALESETDEMSGRYEKQDLSEEVVYQEEIVLPNGLRLKVDGVYLDGDVPYALIGPEIVKVGDTIEGVVRVNYIDFNKVGVEYNNRQYYLMVR
ncbi:MAG: hypothetical protein JW928_03230 [Candidatus Aureabacteria bacterium]|nr:hypothetical protein [Candidatus Auribacterota bacterium]